MTRAAKVPVPAFAENNILARLLVVQEIRTGTIASVGVIVRLLTSVTMVKERNCAETGRSAVRLPARTDQQADAQRNQQMTHQRNITHGQLPDQAWSLGRSTLP
jgi:hypothetical protein